MRHAMAGMVFRTGHSICTSPNWRKNGKDFHRTPTSDFSTTRRPGYGDLTVRGDHPDSPSQLEAIRRVKPKLAVFGHIHEGRGVWTLDHGQQQIILANVSAVDERYHCIYEEMQWELPF